MRPPRFDQNLSPRFVELLSDLYRGSTHVSMVGLDRALDSEIWEYAREHDQIIVTKDADFSELGLLQGFPPKVVWIRRGNCSTAEIAELPRESGPAIGSLSDDPHTGILTLF